ncbi:MAG TPA: tripartite tricarboxylate transporter TctB family protein [Thermodesulfobacteriota bacterium]
MTDKTRGAAPERSTGGGLIRAPQDFAAGASLVALALFALWASADLSQGRLGHMGPGMLPRATAVLIGLLGIGIAIGACLRPGPPLERWGIRGPLFVFLGVLAFALTIRSVGLVVAGPLVALIGGAASPETRLGEAFVFAAAITAFCIGLFKYALNLPIPVLVIPGVVVL